MTVRHINKDLEWENEGGEYGNPLRGLMFPFFFSGELSGEPKERALWEPCHYSVQRRGSWSHGPAVFAFVSRAPDLPEALCPPEHGHCCLRSSCAASHLQEPPTLVPQCERDRSVRVQVGEKPANQVL